MPLDWKWIPPLTILQLDHIFEKIHISNDPDGCYLWEGARNEAGYGIVFLDRERFRATRVIYFVVTGVDPGEQVVRHTCDNPPCVRFEHMLLGSDEDNRRDAMERGRFASGERNGAYTHPEKWKRGEEQKNAKLTGQAVLLARKLYSEGETARELAETFGVCSQTMQAVLRGEVWAHVEGPIIPSGLKKGPRGPTGPRTAMKPRVAITAEIKEAAKRLLGNGIAAKDVAIELNISLPSVYNIIREKRIGGD